MAGAGALMRRLSWLLLGALTLATGAAAAAPTAAATTAASVPAAATAPTGVALSAVVQAQADSECPPASEICGDPAFPPPPAVETPDTTQPATGGKEIDDGTTDDSVELGWPTGGGFGDPLWFLPEEPDFEFAYDQQNYDLWLARCGGDLVDQTTGWNSFANEAAGRDLPEVFWELYGDADRACPDDRRATTTLMANAIGGDTVGRAGIPSSSYDIGADQGAWNHVTRKLWINITSLFFSFTKWMTGSTINLLDWAFGFDLAARLAEPANAMASGYYVSLNGSAISVYDLALFITLCFFALQLLRGRVVAAGAELAITLLIYVAFVAFIVLVPGGFGKLITDINETSGRLAASIAAISLEGQGAHEECPEVDGESLEDVSCPFAQVLHATFIERPYDLLNWGSELGSGGDPSNPSQACALARDAILLEGPHGTSDVPRFRMGTAGCEQLADFNHDPTPERAGLSLMVLLTAVLVLILVAVSSLTLTAAQLLVVYLGMLLPFAFAAGLLPGSGRSMLWKWVGAVARAVMAVIGVAAFLSIYLATVSVMGEATADASWLIQGGSMVLLTVVMVFVRRRLMEASKRAGASLGERLNRANIGGGAQGFFTAASTGFAAGGAGQSWRPSGYIPYEAQSMYRDVRQMPVNAAEWRTNTRIRRGLRTGRLDPATTPRPPRGFTASRRHRSQARLRRRTRQATGRR